MKKKVLSLLLSLSLLAGLQIMPAGAYLRTIEEMKPDEVRTISTEGGAPHYHWSSSDPSVATCTDNGTSKSVVTAKKPGTAVITVTCTRRKPDLVKDPFTGKFVTGTTTYEDRDTCTIVVKDPSAPTPPKVSSLPAPSKSYGSIGDDVSGIITDIQGFNCGVVPVKYKNLWGLADADLKLLIPFQFSLMDWVSNDGHIHVKLDGQRYVIDTKGNVVYSHSPTSSKDRIEYGNNHILIKRYYGTGSGDFLVERYNYQGEPITSAQASVLNEIGVNESEARGELVFDRPRDSKNGGLDWLFNLPTDYNDNPKTVLRVPAYGTQYHPSWLMEGLIVFGKEDLDGSNYGAVDKNGKLVIPCDYDMLYDSSGGWLSYKQGDKCGLLKNPVNPPSEPETKPADSSPAKPSTPDASTKPAAPATSPSSDFTIENGVLVKYNGKGGKVTIPDTVTEIGEKAFYECTDLTSVVMPDTVTKIGKRAFYFCFDLSSVKVSSSLREIGDQAFWNCSALTSFKFPDSIREIGNLAFSACDNLTSISFPVGLERISKEAFAGCSRLKSVTIHSKSADIGKRVFIIIGDKLQRVPNPGLTVTAPAGSTAETYCKENGLSFKPLSGTSTANK